MGSASSFTATTDCSKSTLSPMSSTASGWCATSRRYRDIVKGWIDEHLDHKMLLRTDDPVIPALTELGEPLYLLDVNPTAENIAKHIYRQAHDNGLPLSEVRLWETPSSYATYRED